MRRSLKVQKTAHFHTLNSELPADTILYVVHGYAQLAEDFLKEFSFLKGKNIHVIAPEALHSFYGKERTPVCSWMTSHEREDDIKDYTAYLRALHELVTAENKYESVYVLGFSQGLSTLFRWLKASRMKVDGLFCCCGSIPPEITMKDGLNELIKECYYYYGDEDRLMKPESAKRAQEKLSELAINFQYISFHGRHEISDSCKKAISIIAEKPSR